MHVAQVLGQQRRAQEDEVQAHDHEDHAVVARSVDEYTCAFIASSSVPLCLSPRWDAHQQSPPLGKLASSGAGGWRW